MIILKLTWSLYNFVQSSIGSVSNVSVFFALFFFFTIKQKALSHFYLGSVQLLVATPERVAALCLSVLRFAAVGQGLVAGLDFVSDFFLYQFFCECIWIKLSE